MSIYSNGIYGFEDVHHRVKSAQILDEMIRIKIVRNDLLRKDPTGKLWWYWHGLVAQGLIPNKDLNPEGWILKSLEEAKDITGR